MEDGVSGLIVGAVIVGLLIVLLAGLFYIIPAGYGGVLMTFGKVEPMPISAGIHVKVPLIQSVVKMEVRTQKYEAEQKITQAQAEAEALRLQKQEITPELLQLRQIEVQSKALDIQAKAIERWDGVLPTYTGGAMPFIDITAVQR